MEAMNISNITETVTEDFLVRHICQYFVLITSLIGNGFLVIILVKLRGVKKLVDKLILNLAACQCLLVLSSIPTSLALDNAGADYPFGLIGCKLIDPLSTYAVNTGVFTLQAIAFERWKVVSRPFALMESRKRVLWIFAILHGAGALSVIPYSIHLRYGEDSGTITCQETWSITSRQVFTITLFMLQYGLAVPIMLALYGKAWMSVQASNEQLFKTIDQSSTDSGEKNGNYCYKQVKSDTLVPSVVYEQDEDTDNVHGEDVEMHLSPVKSKKFFSCYLNKTKTFYSRASKFVCKPKEKLAAKNDADEHLAAQRKESSSSVNSLYETHGEDTEKVEPTPPKVLKAMHSCPPSSDISTKRSKTERRLSCPNDTRKNTSREEPGKKSRIKRTVSDGVTQKQPWRNRAVRNKNSFPASKTNVMNRKANNNNYVHKQSSIESMKSKRSSNHSQNASVRSSLMRYFSPTVKRRFTDSVQDNAMRRRYNQSRDLLTMFTVVVGVFVVFMLPNQILWLLIDFGSKGYEHFNPLVRDIMYILTYANCVLNPVIYGRLNKNFRKDFKRLFKELTFSKKKNRPKRYFVTV